jgi:hypothetical protein
MRLSLALVMLLHCAGAAQAKQYVLRLEEVGYFDVPESEKAPQGRMLNSIEVLTEPGAPFHSKVASGVTALSLTGRLTAMKDGDFAVQLKFVHVVARGSAEQPEGGTPAPPESSSVCQTTATISSGKQATLSDLQSVATLSDKTRLKSVTRIMLSLEEFDPEQHALAVADEAPPF